MRVFSSLSFLAATLPAIMAVGGSDGDDDNSGDFGAYAANPPIWTYNPVSSR